ncbi:hypothetical protein [Shewanella waksmanii]|uniref:hypothetical protein n=1 Tax=Shewanella waksmanii TaxID=213783 RepID=UPI00048D1289|nr:hypothetical protein [Shewanella waksmanii]
MKESISQLVDTTKHAKLTYENNESEIERLKNSVLPALKEDLQPLVGSLQMAKLALNQATSTNELKSAKSKLSNLKEQCSDIETLIKNTERKITTNQNERNQLHNEFIRTRGALAAVLVEQYQAELTEIPKEYSNKIYKLLALSRECGFSAGYDFGQVFNLAKLKVNDKLVSEACDGIEDDLNYPLRER